MLGLGNDILTDDLAGLLVARRLRETLAGEAGIDVLETTEMGLALLDLVEGYDGLVLVDAVLTRSGAPGTLHEFNADQLDTVPGMAPHGLGLGEVLAAGRELGLRMPRWIRMFGVEASDPFSLGVAPTALVAAALPGLCDRVAVAAREMVAAVRD